LFQERLAAVRLHPEGAAVTVDRIKAKISDEFQQLGQFPARRMSGPFVCDASPFAADCFCHADEITQDLSGLTSAPFKLPAVLFAMPVDAHMLP
jgi:hypothetical protein